MGCNVERRVVRDHVADFQKTTRDEVLRFASLRQLASLPCASIILAPLPAGQVTCNYFGGTKLNPSLHSKKEFLPFSPPSPTRPT